MVDACDREDAEAQVGFAPTNSGFADRGVRLLHHCATKTRIPFLLALFNLSALFAFNKQLFKV